MPSIKSSFPTLAARRRLACRVRTLKFPSSMDALNVNRRTWVEALTRRRRDEAGSLVPSETTLPPLQLWIANDNIFWGVDPHQRKDPEKENNRRTGVGGAGTHGARAELRWYCLWSECLKTNDCVVV